MLDAGIGLETIGQMLDHANIRTTQVYAYVTPKATKRAVHILESELLANVVARHEEIDKIPAWFVANISAARKTVRTKARTRKQPGA